MASMKTYREIGRKLCRYQCPRGEGLVARQSTHANSHPLEGCVSRAKVELPEFLPQPLPQAGEGRCRSSYRSLSRRRARVVAGPTL